MKETTNLDELDRDALVRAAMTSLGSKVVSRHREVFVDNTFMIYIEASH